MVSLEAKDSPDLTLPANPFRSMQTGQNSIAPESSLPQLFLLYCPALYIRKCGFCFVPGANTKADSNTILDGSDLIIAIEKDSLLF
jgi:hypothetical protein